MYRRWSSGLAILHRYALRRLALLWFAAHALSAADRSYILALNLAALARITSAQLAHPEPEPAHTGSQDGGTDAADSVGTQLQTAQNGILAALTSAAEQHLSSVNGTPAPWVLQSIHHLLQVSTRICTGTLYWHTNDLPHGQSMAVLRLRWCRARRRAQLTY